MFTKMYIYLYENRYILLCRKHPKNARVRQTLALKDNRLTAKAVVDSMGIYLTYKDRYKEEVKVQTIETVIEKEVNILHWWQKALMWAGAIALLSFILFLLIHIVIRK